MNILTAFSFPSIIFLTNVSPVRPFHTCAHPFGSKKGVAKILPQLLFASFFSKTPRNPLKSFSYNEITTIIPFPHSVCAHAPTLATRFLFSDDGEGRSQRSLCNTAASSVAWTCSTGPLPRRNPLR
ncbi:uncharacterized protein F4822DRAFT_126656 [Hypoxylon trugodes]|uniref:uncharacterized protein n=1 Tax=Hypoxylon trugodes TaxID=326681 RepID=UPI00218CBF78|nr:uncharacterized protein F4822DRAFT_126656 [Hypoxylon trugodes]KAI1392362.1 hypothetical protein F4822DRAFT_126656 [Hypoxylon trugodes]